MKILDLEVNISSNKLWETTTINVGNSGLVLRQSNDEAVLDFIPEGNCNPVEGKAQQYALTFLGAMGALMEWDQCNAVPHLPETIHIETNAQMGHFILRNLRAGAELVRDYGQDQSLIIKPQVIGADPHISASLARAEHQVLMQRYFVDDAE